MNKIKKEKLDVLKFEPVSFEGKKMIGGFSDDITMTIDDGGGHGNGSNLGYCKETGATNNCNGGNCVKGCGAQ